jgi:hypothetical protein
MWGRAAGSFRVRISESGHLFRKSDWSVSHDALTINLDHSVRTDEFRGRSTIAAAIRNRVAGYCRKSSN